MSLLPITRAASLTTTLLFTALPHGGQRTARRNAWASMSDDAALAGARHEANAALLQAEVRSRAVAVGH